MHDETDQWCKTESQKKKKKPNILGSLLYNEGNIASQWSIAEIRGKGFWYYWLAASERKKEKKNAGCILHTFVRETLNRLKI